jgi:EAL domain-containing protein (putative c-di-GMP-specific phosphodiesterase class I)
MFSQEPTPGEPGTPVPAERVAELQQALVRGEFELHLQPRIDLASDRCTVAEALLRWQHPALGRLLPGEFLPLAVAAGLGEAVTRAAIRDAIDIAARWQAAGRPLGIAVNLAASDLRDRTLPAYVSEQLADGGLAPELLTLEAMEDDVMAQADDAAPVLMALRGVGVQLALDDFGSGRSSLAALARLPFTELKVDRAYVGGLARDPARQLVVRAALDLARHFGLQAVAVGVEDAATLELLRRMGFGAAQGFLIAPPLPEGQFDFFVRNSRWGRGPRAAATPPAAPVATGSHQA